MEAKKKEKKRGKLLIWDIGAAGVVFFFFFLQRRTAERQYSFCTVCVQCAAEMDYVRDALVYQVEKRKSIRRHRHCTKEWWPRKKEILKKVERRGVEGEKEKDIMLENFRKPFAAKCICSFTLFYRSHKRVMG